MNARGPYSARAIWRKRAAARIRKSMPIRQRKLIGAVLLLALVIVWSLVGVAVAQAPLLKDHRGWQFVFYIVAGLGWVLPAMPLIKWMSKKD
jgi:predicted membrane channel-forming protein YqfA (hemolysin III family)